MAWIVNTKSGKEIHLKISDGFNFKPRDRSLFVNHFYYQQELSRPYLEGGERVYCFKFPGYRFDENSQRVSQRLEKNALIAFLDCNRQLLKLHGIDPDLHLDHLLFLSTAYDYFGEESYKKLQSSKSNHSNTRLLAELLLIKSDITRSNIHKYVDDINDILGHLSVVTGKVEDEKYLTDGIVNLSLISPQIWKKLTTQIQNVNSFRISLESDSPSHYQHPENTKTLYFSKCISFQLRRNGKGLVSQRIEISSPQEEFFVEAILHRLVNHEKVNKTELFNLISSSSFRGTPNELNPFIYQSSRVVGKVLHDVSLLINNYLIEYGLAFKPIKKGDLTLETKNFLYGLFLLQGLLPKKGIKWNTASEITSIYENYKTQYLNCQPNYFASKLTDSYK